MSLIAKYFYKSSFLEKGKVYAMLETNILENSRLLTFEDLVKIAKNLISHNLGSNKL